jgi:hypothetical protein
MARIRSIKPEIRTSEKVNSWPVEVRYFWIMLWGYVDDHGKGRDNAKLIVADTYPLDDDVTHKDVEGWLQILADSQVIERYEVGGSKYLIVRNWREHQKPSHPAKSVIPDPPQTSGDSPESSGNPPEDYASTPEAVEHSAANGSPEQGAESREQRAGEQGRAAAHPIPRDFSLTPERRAWASEHTPAVNVERETAGFVDYWLGEQGRKKNWDTTWRNWMRRKQTEAEGRGWKPAAAGAKDLSDPMNW